MKATANFRLGITGKYISITMLLVFLVVYISNTLVYNKIFNYVETSSLESTLTQTHMYSEQLNTWLAPYETILKETSKYIGNMPARDLDEVQDYFQAMHVNNDNVLLMYMVYQDNYSVFSDYWDAGLDYPFDEMTWITAPIANDAFTYIEPEYDVIFEKLVIIMGMPVYNDSHEFLGVAGLYINLDDVINKLSELNINHDDQNYLFLSDAQGNLIAHPNPDYQQVGDQRVHMDDLTEINYDHVYNTLYSDAKDTAIIKGGNTTLRYFASDVGITGWKLIQCQDGEYIKSLERFSRAYMLFIVSSGMIVISIILFLIIRSLCNSFKSISNELNKLSNGDIKDYIPFTKIKNDETGDMCSALNHLAVSYKQIISNINTNRHTLNETSMQLSEGVSNFDKTFSHALSNIDSIRDQIINLSGDIESSRHEISDLSVEIQEIYDEIHAITEEINNTNSLSKDGLDVVNGLDRIETINSTQFEEIIYLLDNFKDASLSIEDITKNISALSEQTNLLALNASIEAARAQTDGKGFMVVAREVKTLSADTQACVDSIAILLRNMDQYNKKFLTIKSTNADLVDERKSIHKATKTAYQAIDTSVGNNLSKVHTVYEKLSLIEVKQSTIKENFDKIEQLSQEISNEIEAISVQFTEQHKLLDTISSINEKLVINKEQLDNDLNQFNL